jgi:hypothetical protein
MFHYLRPSEIEVWQKVQHFRANEVSWDREKKYFLVWADTDSPESLTENASWRDEHYRGWIDRDFQYVLDTMNLLDGR